MASYEQTRDTLMRQRPTFLPSEDHVLEHLFAVGGNGYHWVDGELVSMYPRADAEVHLDRAKYRAYAYAHFKRIGREIDFPDLADVVMKVAMKPFPKLTMLLGYDEDAEILHLPDDIKPDWLDAAWRAYHLICSVPGWPCTVFVKIWERLFYLWRTQ